MPDPDADAHFLAHLFGVLGCDARLHILGMLGRAGEMTVREIAAALGISPVGASHHLGELRGVGLVDSRPDGNLRHYRLTPGAVRWPPEAFPSGPPGWVAVGPLAFRFRPPA